MIQTVFSSFLFLYPIYLSYLFRDLFGLMMFSIGMALSIANHSHTFNPFINRRKMFESIDQYYFRIVTAYLTLTAFYRIYWLIIISMGIINIIIYLSLGKESKEKYNTKQKFNHVIFHIIGIASLSFLRFL